MDETGSNQVGQPPARTREENTPLVERLDESLGEASSGIGVLLSELVRRTLRGGVQRIDTEIQEFVDEKLDDAVASRMPTFEDVATRTASEKAKRIAESAVAAVDEKAQQSAAELSERIVVATTTMASLDAETKQTAEQLKQQIVTVEERATAAISHSEAASSRFDNELAHAKNEAVETSSRIEQQLQDVKAESQRTTERMLEDLQRKAKNTAGKIDGSLRKLQQQGKQLADALAAEQARRAETEEALRAETQQVVDQMQGRIELLEAEIRELKRPRGLAALGAKLFGGNNRKQPATSTTPSPTSEDGAYQPEENRSSVSD